MLRAIVLGVAVVGLVAPAFGQGTVSFTSEPGVPLNPGDTATVSVWFQDLGDVADFSLDLGLGSAVSLAGAPADAIVLGPSIAGRGFPDVAGIPFGWSQFLDPTPMSVGAEPVLAATLDVALGANADASNSTIEVLAGGATFFTDPAQNPITPSFDGIVLVPEPATVALLLAGVGGGVIAHRRRRRA